jgi:hypothetical protein
MIEIIYQLMMEQQRISIHEWADLQRETRRQGAESASPRPPVSSNSLVPGENLPSSIPFFRLAFQKIHGN